MKRLVNVFFLACGIICTFASIEERILDLENVVQGQLAENEKMKNRVNELEHEVTALVAMEKEGSANYKGDRHLIETRSAPQNGSPGHFLTRATSSSTGFHAYLSATTCYENYVKIVFDTETQDTVGWYDARDGEFEAREPGVYVFTWTVAAPTNIRVTTELVIGGTMRGVITTDSDKVQNNDGSGSGIHPATGVVVARMSTGDRCYIRARHMLHGCLNIHSSSSTVRSTFSGWKLF